MKDKMEDKIIKLIGCIISFIIGIGLILSLQPILFGLGFLTLILTYILASINVGGD